MIPKVIHYCWFGKGEKDALFYKCLESWRRFFPGYEIIEWNEDNFDVNFMAYTREAYKEKKYAFVSDVVRLKVLYDHGGIYFDTDVEVIKRFPDDILEKGYFAEEENGIIATGLGMAAPAGNQAIKTMLDGYKYVQFVRKDGSIDLTPCPRRNSLSLEDAGYSIIAGQEIEGIEVYDNRYFCGYDYKNHQSMISDETLSVHHYAASWQSSKERKIGKLKEKLSGFIGLDNYKRLRDFKKNLKENPKKELRKHADILFFIGYFSILANQFLQSIVSLQPILPFFDVIGVIFLTLFILINIRSYRIRDFVIIGALAVIFGIVAWKSHDKTLLKLLGILAAFRGIDFKKFIKNDFKVRLFLFLTIVLLSFCGLTVTSHSMRNNVLRQSFGFEHPNAFGFCSLILAMEAVYISKRKILPIVFVGVLLVVNYFLVDSRAATMVLLLLFIYVLIPYRWSRAVVKNFPVKQVVCCSFLLFLAFSIFMTFNWKASDNNWIFKVNRTLSNRFYFTQLVEKEYPANTLFGNYFEKRDGYEAAPSMSSVLTVDNGYMYSLMFLGVVTTCVLAFLYTLSFIKLYRTKNYTLVVILFLVCLYLISEGKITDIGVNPFLFLLGLALFGNWNNYERGDAAKLMGHSRRNLKRVLLISQINTTDFGKLLEIFCFKKALEGLSVKVNGAKEAKTTRVDTLNFDIQEPTALRRRKSMKNGRHLNFRLGFLRINLWPELKIRNMRLNRFRRRKLNPYPIDPIRMRDDLRHVDKFGMYVVGSDQVWDAHKVNAVNNLKWLPASSLKTTYAPQISGGSLGEASLAKYDFLKDFTMLSTEGYTYAITQINSVTESDFHEVINPIALYGKEALLEYCRRSKKADYCLCYLSGDSSLHRRYALRYTEYNKLKLRAVMGLDDEHLLVDKCLMPNALWNLTPFKLVNQVFNAGLVITDSMDVLVLCVLFHKNFIALCREGHDDLENYRMYNFLEKIGLGQRFNKAPVDNKDSLIKNSEWKKADKKIEQMKEESFAYLYDMLKCINGDQKGNKVNKA